MLLKVMISQIKDAAAKSPIYKAYQNTPAPPYLGFASIGAEHATITVGMERNEALSKAGQCRDCPRLWRDAFAAGLLGGRAKQSRTQSQRQVPSTDQAIPRT